jgi:8-oxo-dGTP diphosphatase
MVNAFEIGARRCIPAVLVYARHGGRVLMVHRGGRPGDYHAGRWNGLGGKCEPDESPLQTARREFHEEAGALLDEARFRPLGVLTFPNFKAHKAEDWIVTVFTVECEPEQVATKNDEGELHWVPEADLMKLNLWPGDQHFMSHILSGRPFLGTIWYEGPEVKDHWVQAL